MSRAGSAALCVQREESNCLGLSWKVVRYRPTDILRKQNKTELLLKPGNVFFWFILMPHLLWRWRNGAWEEISSYHSIFLALHFLQCKQTGHALHCLKNFQVTLLIQLISSMWIRKRNLEAYELANSPDRLMIGMQIEIQVDVVLNGKLLWDKDPWKILCC